MQKPSESTTFPPHPASPQPMPDEEGPAEEQEAAPGEEPAALEVDSGELPHGVEETIVVLLPVNPHLVHVYWQIAPRDLEKVGSIFSRMGPRAQPVLRFYDAAQGKFDGASPSNWFEVQIALGVGSWYVCLETPARAYCVDLGLCLAGSGFHRLARSNVAETPRGRPSDKPEEGRLRADGDSSSGIAVPPLAVAKLIETLPELSPDAPPAGGGNWPEFSGPLRGAPARAAQRRWDATEPEGEGGGYILAAPADDIEPKIAEDCRQPSWEWPGHALEATRAGEPQNSISQRADLTELSERSFCAGLSSRHP